MKQGITAVPEDETPKVDRKRASETDITIYRASGDQQLRTIFGGSRIDLIVRSFLPLNKNDDSHDAKVCQKLYAADVCAVNADDIGLVHHVLMSMPKTVFPKVTSISIDRNFRNVFITDLWTSFPHLTTIDLSDSGVDDDELVQISRLFPFLENILFGIEGLDPYVLATTVFVNCPLASIRL